MTKDERESIIAQLALIQGVNPAVFDRYSDDQLRNEMQKAYGK